MPGNLLGFFAALAIPAALFGQNTAAPSTPYQPDGPYQVTYASNLSLGDSVINVTNDGWSAGTNVPSANPWGDMCVNVYVYTPAQNLAVCCTCLVTPNGLHSWPVYFGPRSLLSEASASILNEIFSQGTSNGSVVIKLLGTIAGGIGTGAGEYCTRSDVLNPLAYGLIAWATHAHPSNNANALTITETPFVNGNLSPWEFAKLTGDCSNWNGNVDKACPGCQSGGLAKPSL